MSFQITVDPSTLTPEQREHLAGFIMSYPSADDKIEIPEELASEQINKLKSELGRIDRIKDVVIAEQQEKSHAREIDADRFVTDMLRSDPALTQLVADGNQTDAEIAFGDPQAMAAFAPLPVGATPAPSTVAASQPLTVQEVQSSGENPTVAFIPPAPPSANAETTAAPADTSRAEIDKNGLPWDARIHASTKRKNADGTWTNKRGIDESFRTQIEAELHQAMGAPAAVASAADTAWPFTPPAQQMMASAKFVPSAPVVFDGTVPPNVNLAVGAGGSGGIAPPVSDPKAAFVSLVGRTAAALQGGKITQKEVVDICSANGLAALPLLANRLDLVAQVANQIDMLIASR